MRIFHVITHFDLGGAERVAASIAKSKTIGMDYHIVELMRGNSSFTNNFISNSFICTINKDNPRMFNIFVVIEFDTLEVHKV